MALRKRCPICGRRVFRLHAHHPALEENLPDAVIYVCGVCHNKRGGLTLRAYETGMLKDVSRTNRPPRSEPERLWCIAQGSGDMVAAVVRSAARRLGSTKLEEDASTMELLGPAMARLFTLLAEADGVELATPLGPEPAKNMRRRKRTRGLAVPPLPAAAFFDQLIALRQFLLDFSRSIAWEIRSTPTAYSERLAASQDQTTDALTAVGQHPTRVMWGLLAIFRGPWEQSIGASMGRVQAGMRAGLAAMIHAQDLDAVLAGLYVVLKACLAAERAGLVLLVALANGADPIREGNRMLATLAEEGP